MGIILVIMGAVQFFAILVGLVVGMIFVLLVVKTQGKKLSEFRTIGVVIGWVLAGILVVPWSAYALWTNLEVTLQTGKQPIGYMSFVFYGVLLPFITYSFAAIYDVISEQKEKRTRKEETIENEG